jgi:hypothetical protein
MALEAGNESADNGMSKAIYDALYDSLKANFDEEKPPDDVCDSWRKLAYSIAFGVIEHIKSNMEINGIEVAVSNVSTTVTVATTCPSGEGTGTGTGSGTAEGQQSNDGTGHVQ